MSPGPPLALGLALVLHLVGLGLLLPDPPAQGRAEDGALPLAPVDGALAELAAAWDAALADSRSDHPETTAAPTADAAPAAPRTTAASEAPDPDGPAGADGSDAMDRARPAATVPDGAVEGAEPRSGAAAPRRAETGSERIADRQPAVAPDDPGAEDRQPAVASDDPGADAPPAMAPVARGDAEARADTARGAGDPMADPPAPLPADGAAEAPARDGVTPPGGDAVGTDARGPGAVDVAAAPPGRPAGRAGSGTAGAAEPSAPAAETAAAPRQPMPGRQAPAAAVADAPRPGAGGAAAADTASSAAGAPAAAPGRDAAAARDAAEAAHAAAVRQALARQQRPLPGRETGVATLHLVIGRDGSLQRAEVRALQGSARIERAALDAARAVGRFPAAPDDLPGARFSFEVRLVYR